MIPKYLYHYTSMESVLKIIDSGCLRFTRLDFLNDPKEGYFYLDGYQSNEPDIRKSIYCSSWCEGESEDISLWHIYTQMMGVRIKMRALPFGAKTTVAERKAKYEIVTDLEPIRKIGDYEIKRVRGPIKIEYCDNLEQIFDVALDFRQDKCNDGLYHRMNMIDVNELGVKKLNCWRYEREWRYIVNPFSMVAFADNSSLQFPSFGLPEYIDIKFDCEIEEIILGPQFPLQKREIFKRELANRNTDIPIRESDLKTNFDLRI